MTEQSKFTYSLLGKAFQKQTKTIECQEEKQEAKGELGKAKTIEQEVIRDDLFIKHTQPAFTCLKSTIETLEQGVKYV